MELICLSQTSKRTQLLQQRCKKIFKEAWFLRYSTTMTAGINLFNKKKDIV